MTNLALQVPRHSLADDVATIDRQTHRLLFLGTCQVGPVVVDAGAKGLVADHLLYESYSHAAIPACDLARYDASVVALTLRHFFIEASHRLNLEAGFGNCIEWPRLVASGNEQAFFDACAALVEERVDRLCAALAGKPAFFLSFTEPKHNYLGNLMPRYHLSNPKYLVECLNQVLAAALARHRAAYFLDVNELLDLVGRFRIQDDYVGQVAHASYLHAFDLDGDRIQPSSQPFARYESDEALAQLGDVLMQRLVDDLAIIRRPLAVKAIIVDLDDTLWRGIAAEDFKPAHEFIEGWPLGMAEALLIYQARGGMLAVCSKNDHDVIAERFRGIYGSRLTLDDFASVRINFQRKSENVADILRELNILPEHALFVDDNPREIAEVRAAFPAMRFLSAEHYDWRRRILLSPETQVAAISPDAQLRTRSVQATVARQQRQADAPSPEEWLAGLGLVQRVERVGSADHPRFPRAFELLNKTNQFNTNGVRWAPEEIDALFAGGGILLCSMLSDRIADHGMISVLVLRCDAIEQAVLSCRAFGNGAELAAGHVACRLILERGDVVRGAIRDTGRNRTSHGYFTALGFDDLGGGAFVTHRLPPMPPHIRLVEADRVEALAV